MPLQGITGQTLATHTSSILGFVPQQPDRRVDDQLLVLDSAEVVSLA